MASPDSRIPRQADLLSAGSITEPATKKERSQTFCEGISQVRRLLDCMLEAAPALIESSTGPSDETWRRSGFDTALLAQGHWQSALSHRQTWPMQIDAQIMAVRTSQGGHPIERQMLGEAF